MTDDKELIARLRSMHWCVTTEANGVGVSDSKVALDAADRIESLTKELDELQEVVRCHCDEAFWYQGLQDPQCQCDSAEAVKVVASRIEALTKKLDEADDLAKAAFADGASNNIRLAETSYRVKWLEAKLAKAVEALRQIADPISLAQGNVNAEIALATLAEIKGEGHD